MFIIGVQRLGILVCVACVLFRVVVMFCVLCCLRVVVRCCVLLCVVCELFASGVCCVFMVLLQVFVFVIDYSMLLPLLTRVVAIVVCSVAVFVICWQ